MSDLRYACRTLNRNRGFATGVILILALGIGANTAVFSLVNAILLKDLPVDGPQELVWFGAPSFSYPIFQEVRARSGDLFSRLFAWNIESVDVEWEQEARQTPALFVSGEFYSILRNAPALGRLLAPQDDLPAGGTQGPVAVISADCWERRFRRDRAVVGRTIRIERLVNDRVSGDTFDNNGNTVSSGGHTFVYDFEDRRTQYDAAVAMTYDGDGKRVARSEGGVTIRYLIDDVNPTGYTQIAEESFPVNMSHELHYRPLKVAERELLEKLLEQDFPGRDELRRQLDSVAAREVDDDGSLDLQVGSSWPAPVKYRVPTEGACPDADGVMIHILLHIVNGALHELEIFKEDSSKVLRPPTARALVLPRH